MHVRFPETLQPQSRCCTAVLFEFMRSPRFTFQSSQLSWYSREPTQSPITNSHSNFTPPPFYAPANCSASPATLRCTYTGSTAMLLSSLDGCGSSDSFLMSGQNSCCSSHSASAPRVSVRSRSGWGKGGWGLCGGSPLYLCWPNQHSLDESP